jgi:hypothetical protein
MMTGVWFLSLALGNKLGAIAASFFDSVHLLRVLRAMGWLELIACCLLLLIRRPIERLANQEI